WSDDSQVLIPNALQPAEVEDVILCELLGRAIVLVREDQLSLAIGRRGQNVRLASKLVGWDINVMTQESLDEQLDISIEAFSVVPEMAPELVENLVSQGFFTFDDLSVIEPDQLAELGGLTQEQCDTIVDFADVESLRIEKEEKLAAEERKRNPPPSPEEVAAAEAVAKQATESDESSEKTEESAPAAEQAAEVSTDSDELEDKDVVATEDSTDIDGETTDSTVTDAAETTDVDSNESAQRQTEAADDSEEVI
ncbi:MAG: transcription termination factor NusA, partial [Fuerstiella sp.]|nr:transcription termination factor NusA [Fuerstiella sp.]